MGQFRAVIQSQPLENEPQIVLERFDPAVKIHRNMVDQFGLIEYVDVPFRGFDFAQERLEPFVVVVHVHERFAGDADVADVSSKGNLVVGGEQARDRIA